MFHVFLPEVSLRVNSKEVIVAAGNLHRNHWYEDQRM